MRLCNACGAPNAHIEMGGVLFCRACSAAVEEEIKILHEAGKPVNVAHIARRMFRQTNQGGDYLLRDIPADLRKAAEHLAVEENRSLRDIILSALHRYVQK